MNAASIATELERLGRELDWTIEDPQPNLARAASAIASGERVLFVQETGAPIRLPYAVSHASSWQALECEPRAFVVLASDRLIDHDRCLVYRPKSLVLGVGCKRGLSFDDFERGVLQTLAAARLSPNSLHSLATLDRKQDEPALLTFAEAHRLPIRFYSASALAAISGSTPGSDQIERHVGTHSVCEPAALLASGARALLVAKIIPAAAAMTIAIARIPFTLGVER
ncbi:MAG TPA: cobalamin biosynthesis protein [Polyangiales bacterium]|nr:cobalamin biosynthesis protein [Polyangiales bacterium]